MRKSGKKFVSFVLATAMTLTTFVANTSFVSAATNGSFDATALATPAADKEALAASELSAPFGVDGTVTKRVSWADEAKTVPAAVSSIEVAKANGGALTVTVDGPATITALMSSTGSANESAIGIADASGNIIVQDTVAGTASTAKEITADVTAAGTYRVMSPEDADRSRGARVYTVTVTAKEGGSTEETTVSTETTTEAPVETTTEAPVETTTTVAPVETTTEAPTEATTSAPVATNYTYVVATEPAAIAEGATIFTNADFDFVASQPLEAAAMDAPTTVDGVEFANRLKSTGVDTAATIDGTEYPKVRVFGAITAKTSNNISVALKVGSTKNAFIATKGADGTFTSVWSDMVGNGSQVVTFAATAGTSYYLIGKGTNLEVFGVNVGGSASSDVTTETTTAVVTEATTEAVTDAPTEATTAEDANIAAIKGGKTGVVAEVAGAKDGMVVAKTGDYIDVDFVMYNSSNIHALTYFIEYDPSVLIVESFNEKSATGRDMLSYEMMAGFPPIPYAAPAGLNAADGNLYQKPSADNTDFADLNPDGTKTQPELGRIKDAQMAAMGTTALGTIAAKEAVLVSAHMKVVGNAGASSPLTFKLVSAADTNVKDIEMLGSTAYIKIVDELPTTTTTTESTTQTTTITTESTTKAPTTEATTEATTKAPTTQTTTQKVETTTDATTEATTTVVDDDTETTTKRKSSGGGGGGGSSSSKASGKEDTKVDPKPGVPSKDDKDPVDTPNTPNTSNDVDVVDYSTFEAPNGTVITPPALGDVYGNVYAGSDIPSSMVESGVFTDTSSRAWAEGSIEKLAALGIINGVGNGKFAPDNNCKRADFIVMLVKTLGITGTATDNFDDVVAGKYYSNAVGLAKEVGIATGYGDGNFGPEKTITRQDMMVLVAKTMEFLGQDITADVTVLDQFADADQMADYAKPFAAYLVSANMVSGTDTGIEPVALMTRAQLAVLVEKLYDAVVELAPAPEAPVEDTTVVEEDTEETTESEDASEETTEVEEASEETTEAETVEETTEEVTEA